MFVWVQLCVAIKDIVKFVREYYKTLVLRLVRVF